MQLTAVIADDEPVLRKQLRRLLAEQWPELLILAEAENGEEAVQLTQQHKPDIVFLDIRMPGLSGMDAALTINKLSLIVFVTAYDEYAIDAFEKKAVDYLLKPVDRARLGQTVERLKDIIRSRNHVPENLLTDILKRFKQTEKTTQQKYLQWLKVGVGDGVRLIHVNDICYFQAADKYTRVVSEAGEELIRTSIKRLASGLDPEEFWQIHRATIVRVGCIRQASRSFTGRYRVHLNDHEDVLTVSRTYGHLFKQM